MKLTLSVLAIASLAVSAAAQTVYEPVRYQYGRYNEVFYGGRASALTSGAYVYLPPALQTASAANRMNTPPFINGYTPYGPWMGGGNPGPFVAPYTPDSAVSTPAYTPFIFSDYLPYQEVSQFGFTIDDARNEAYANVPRLQRASAEGPRPAPVAAAPAPAASPANARAKAIPLLNWAKMERSRNPALYRALIKEAHKYDPAATENVDRSTASEK